MYIGIGFVFMVLRLVGKAVISLKWLLLLTVMIIAGLY